ncbi:chemoreceptor glutamine deamidase CheD [Burkholderiaceae bacterium DAT-1]|nr:chemoreceptor glutamine deamidase CheD [Burkholderiaceae bacterium DAT-1]
MHESALAGPVRYFDSQVRQEAIKIMPGDYHVSDQDIVIVTILGSCVAACIRDRQSGVGGMNHFMLPGMQRDQQSNSTTARYGFQAMDFLISDILRRGGHLSRLEAKVFGGGKVIRDLSSANVGEKNVAFVREFLDRTNIPIVASDVLDTCPRKVYFFPFSGKVLVQRLTGNAQAIERRESEYSSQLRAGKTVGLVDKLSQRGETQ